MKIEEMKKLIVIQNRIDNMEMVRRHVIRSAGLIRIETAGGAFYIEALDLAQTLEENIGYLTAELQESGVEV